SGQASYDPAGGLLTVQLQFANGVMDMTWDGTNDGGGAVSNGEYLMKAEMRDMGGTLRTLTTPVEVGRRGVRLTVRVYTLSGELVKSLYDTSTVGERLSLVDVTGAPLRLSVTSRNTVTVLPKDDGNNVIADSSGSLN